ncbi:MAG: hypothetical protein ACU0CI_13860 [Shimia sp.]
MNNALLALSAFVVALMLALPARAANNCAARATVVDRLADRYGESRRSMGVAANRQLVEVYANDDTGSWSIVVTTPQGQACLVASGTSFEALAAAALPQGEDA